MVVVFSSVVSSCPPHPEPVVVRLYFPSISPLRSDVDLDIASQPVNFYIFDFGLSCPFGWRLFASPKEVYGDEGVDGEGYDPISGTWAHESGIDPIIEGGKLPIPRPHFPFATYRFGDPRLGTSPLLQERYDAISTDSRRALILLHFGAPSRFSLLARHSAEQEEHRTGKHLLLQTIFPVIELSSLQGGERGRGAQDDHDMCSQ